MDLPGPREARFPTPGKTCFGISKMDPRGPRFGIWIWGPGPNNRWGEGLFFKLVEWGAQQGRWNRIGVANPLAKPNPPGHTLEKWVYRDFPFPQIFPISPLGPPASPRQPNG